MKPPSPRQNRVDPWSCLVATPARGQWMGNRGCLHDDQGRIVRDFQAKRWIFCLLEFRARKRSIMQPGRYTELFFLDEATAFAAGHRPCAECQRNRYSLFVDYWVKTQTLKWIPRATEIDSALHAARWKDGPRDGRRNSYEARLGDLPAGTMVAALDNGAPDDGAPHLFWQGKLWRWGFTGYSLAPQWRADALVRVITPKPVVEILVAGYPIHVDSALPRPVAM